MAGKNGKHGHHTGRTLRSPFARSSRREGVLVKKVRQTSENSEEIPSASLIDTISYSLGKQNRWLMPEMIKTSANPQEVVGEESDFLLVEQRSTQIGRRGRCISVYDSSNGKIRKPRRRYGEAQSLRDESSQAELEFEVLYPIAKGSWPLNSEVKYSEKCRGTRKGSSKNRRGKWSESLWSAMVDDYFNEGDEDYDDDGEDFDAGDDDDSDDNAHDNMHFEESKGHSLFISLGEYVRNQAKPPSRIQRQSFNNAVRGQNKCSFKDKVITIDDKERVTEHQRLVANARVMDSLMLSSLKSKEEDLKNTSRKKLKTKRNRSLRQFAALQDEECKKDMMNEDPTMESKNANKQSLHADCISENYPSCGVHLQGTEILASELQKSWGESYREGGCDPRKFAIDLTGLMKSYSKESDIDLAVMEILFELKKPEVKTSDICKASVKLLLHEGLSELNLSFETTELIKREFIDSLSNNGSDVCSVNKIINDGVKSIEKYEILQDQKPSKTSEKKPLYTSDVFAEVLGYKGRSCTEREVFIEARKEVVKKSENDAEGLGVSSSCTSEAACGICFEDFNNEGSLNHTTLLSCGHSFCNSCWEVYIKAMLNMGEIDLLCPGHQCQTPLDGITIMSLATSWYGKYFSWKIKRHITKNPTLKHCPSKGCPLVMQITPCKELKTTTTKSTTTSLPVVCSCNQSWCFQCLEPSHWPSQCEKAQTFRDEYKEYARNFKRDRPKGKDITSVMVKKCPTCSYPIEKFHGCDHMYCIFCRIHFCWQCLTTLSGHNYYDCRNRVIAKSEVKLPTVPKTKMQTLIDIALSNNYARKSTNAIGVQRKLKSMEQGINAYCYLKTRALRNTHSSRITSILEGMIKQNTLMHVKDAFNFKFQAHIVLEGLAIFLVKGSKDHDGTLQNDLMRLVFIMEGLDDLLKKPCSACNEEVVSKLTELIERGKLCIRDIKRHMKNNM
ncbi:uncharacterized protein LOC116304285 [Actinia tenebrosa]|uniref:RBR-type E3 ubiquitin transferase n=1 Tax=Actinia tenebrosa TaxID=6105 RepID=A0A6P8IUK1_ACTTE|nr:uncharacterized protein LOC116304285 [Actinia tenebrosa]